MISSSSKERVKYLNIYSKHISDFVWVKDFYFIIGNI
jgi:hypothetical protein